MNKFLSFLKGLWGFFNSKVFLYIVIIGVCIWLTTMCGSNHDLKIDKKLADQNIAALTDSVKIEKKKNGETQASITAFVSSVDSLKNLNRGLYDKVKQQKGQVQSLTNTVIGLQQDTALLRQTLKSYLKEPIRINDSIWTMEWKLVYNWDNPKTDIDTTTKNYDIFEGTTKILVSVDNGKIKIMTTKILMNGTLIDSIDYLINKKEIYNMIDVEQLNTELFNRNSQIDLDFGEEVVNDKLRVFIKSKYPNFSVKSMEGYFIDPNTSSYIKSLMKKKMWFPRTWSVGVGASGGYNLLTSKPYLGVGVNVNYTIYQW